MSGPEHATWTPEEMRRFLLATRDSVRGPLWHFLATTGARRGEALGLRWRDLDLDAGTASIRQTIGVDSGRIIRNPTTKSGKPRVIDLDVETVATLRRHRAAQNAERLRLGDRWKDEGLVFCRDGQQLRSGRVAGGPLNGDKVSKSFKRACARAGVPDIRLHDVRHTWATLALRAGVPVKVVQERLGHANPSITLGIYAHVLPGMQREAAETVANLFA